MNDVKICNVYYEIIYTVCIVGIHDFLKFFNLFLSFQIILDYKLWILK